MKSLQNLADALFLVFLLVPLMLLAKLFCPEALCWLEADDE